MIPNSALVVFSCLALPALAQDPIVGGPARLAAWERHLALAKASPFSGLRWRALGPKNCGGRVEGIDSPKGRPSILYAGVGSGGVWKSVNGGLSWEHVFRNESTFAVGDVTVDPSDGDTVWVGTGEAHLGGNSYDGTGVFKSSDAGRTWRNMGLHDSARIGKVLVDPTRSEVVWVAAIGRHRGPGGERGVYRSDDGGESWRRSLFGLLAGRDVGRVAIAAAASKAGVLYALMVDHSPPGEGRYDVGGALFRSDDGGDSWARTSEKYVDTYVGWDFCDVVVAPDDADEVYVCGMRLMHSRDGGRTFARGGEKVFRLLDHPGKGMHLDMHDLWIDPQNPDRILVGNDGGLYLSMDRAQSFLHLNNLPIAEFYTVHLDDAEPFRIWGGTQDNASLTAPSTAELTDERSDAWRYVFLDPWDGGDGFATFPDPSGDGTEYYEHQNGDMRRKAPGAPVRWERGSGRRITPKAAEGEPPLRFAWNTPLLPSRHAPGVLYCATQYVMRSKDRGDSWQRISEDLTGGRDAIVSLSESPLDAARLIAGAGRAGVSVTDDGGETWRGAGGGLPRKPVRAVRASEHTADRVFVCLSDAGNGDRRPYLYESKDYGRTWSSLAGELPAEPVNVVIEDPVAKGVLYLGTDLGVYCSIDDGRSWLSLCEGLPTAPVVDMAVHRKEPVLVIVTHGLSAFAADVTPIRAAAAAR